MGQLLRRGKNVKISQYDNSTVISPGKIIIVMFFLGGGKGKGEVSVWKTTVEFLILQNVSFLISGHEETKMLPNG